MSKKMWNKIFKSKTNKNSKTLQATNKINKRNSIYEEYQQLNAAFDIVPINEKFKKDNTKTTTDTCAAALNDTEKRKQKAKIPQSSSTSTAFSRVVNTFTSKRSHSSTGRKDLKNPPGKEKHYKQSELERKAKSTTSLPEITSSNGNINNNISTVTYDPCNKSNCNFNTSFSDTLNEQQLTQDKTAASLNLKLNNINNNEYLACKHILTAPTSLQQQRRLSKIVIVVKKFDNAPAAVKTTPTTTVPKATTCELATNLNNQIFCIDRTNNSSTNQHFYNNESCSLKTTNTDNSNALETSFPLTSATQIYPSTAINLDNQLNLNDIDNTDHYCISHEKSHNDQHLQHTEGCMLCSDTLDNVNDITTPTEVPETNAGVELAPCPICSRTFNPVTLRKHVGICEKMTMKKRNIFDSSRQRREGTDLATYCLPKNFGLPEKGISSTSSTSITHARSERGQSPKPATQQISSPILARKKTSEDLIRSTGRASMRKVVAANNVNTTATAAATSSHSNNFNRDRMRSSERSLTRRGIQPLPAEQCPHCERCFGIKAYDRHVEWCKEKALLASIKQGSCKNDGNAAKARLEARTKYRAPCLKTKRSLNREKYSGLAGEEQETEDAAKCSKSSLNKTKDSSLMSISMTSSMCSERIITNSTTGNINEAVTIKQQKNNNVSVGNHKSTRDKNRIQRTTQKIATVAKATASKGIQNQETVINLQFQMTTNAITKKREQTATTKTKEVTRTAAKIKLLKRHHQYQQPKEQENDLKINSKLSYQKWQTKDVQKNSPPTEKILEAQTSGRDLSLKSMIRDKCLMQQTQGDFPSDNDCYEDLNYRENNISRQYEAIEEASIQNVEISKGVTFYGSLKTNKENERFFRTLSTESAVKQKELKSNGVKDYFRNEEVQNFESEQNSFENISNDSNSVRDLKKGVLATSELQCSSHLNSQNYHVQGANYSRQPEYKNLSKKQSSNESINCITEDVIEPKNIEVTSKERNLTKSLLSKTLILNTELQEIEANKCPIVCGTENEKSHSLKSASQELEVYKHCLTDSDEFRQKLASQVDNVHLGKYFEPKSIIDVRYKDNDVNAYFENVKYTLSPIKSKEYGKETCQRNDLPNKSHCLSAEPAQFAFSKDFSFQKEPSRRITPLKIYQPKRRKVLRSNFSCTNTSPMKAIMLPLSFDKLKICAMSSASLIKTDANSGSTENQIEYDKEKYNAIKVPEEKNIICVDNEAIKVIKESTKLKRDRSFTVFGLPDNYDPFLSAKRQLEELCSPSADSIDMPSTRLTPKLPSVPVTPNSSSKMSTSLILTSSTPNTTPNIMTASQIPTTQQQTQKTPTLTRSSSFRRTSSLRGPRRSPMLSTRPPLFAQKHRPTIQRGLSDEGPISTNFLKTEEYDEMPVRSVCVNDFAVNKSPRVVRRDTSTSNRKQSLKLNINAASDNSSNNTPTPNILESGVVLNNTASKYVSKTDSLAVFLKFEHELENLSTAAADNEHKKENLLESPSSTASTIQMTPTINLDCPLNSKELKDKSNNLSKQNSAKNIKADILDTIESGENYTNNTSDNAQLSTNDLEIRKYGQVRLAPLNTNPNTPLTKPTTTQMPQMSASPAPLSAFNVKTAFDESVDQNPHKSPKPVVLSSLFVCDKKITIKPTASVLYSERKNSLCSDYIDPKLINKWDNLPININLKRTDFKHSDSDTSEPRLENFSSSSSSESSAPTKKVTSQTQQPKFLPTVKQLQTSQQKTPPHTHPNLEKQQQAQHEQRNNLNQLNPIHQLLPHCITNSQRNSTEGRNLLKRRMRLGRNQFLYDASPEGDSCSADDEGANRSSMEGVAAQQHNNSIKEREQPFDRFTSVQVNPIDAAFIPPLPAFDDFDFEEFLSSFENDEEQFPLFKDCREFLMNRTSKKQRSMLMSNSVTQKNTNTINNTQNSTNLKKSPSPQALSPLTLQSQHSNAGSHFQFPSLSQHPKNVFNSFSLNTRTRNKYDALTATKSTDTFSINSHTEECKDLGSKSLNQKREIFISIETEQSDLDKSSISPNSIRNMVGNSQTVVEVEVDAAHDNKFSKISDDDDDADNSQNSCSRSKNFTSSHLVLEHLPNVQLNNAKNLMQKTQLSEDISSGNQRLSTSEHRTAPIDMNLNTKTATAANARNILNCGAGTLSGDAYGDSDELSSLDGYPLSSPNSRLRVSSKTSADSAYGSLSRQRSSELTAQRSSSRNRSMTSNTTNTLFNRPLTEESSLGRSRQLSASSSSSSEHALPPITCSNNSTSCYYDKQHQQYQYQQQQIIFNNNNNNSSITNDYDDYEDYEINCNKNNNVNTLTNLTGATNSHSNLESLHQFNSNSTMSSSMKMSKFCHECGSKFVLDQAKFCMDCGVKRIVL